VKAIIRQWRCDVCGYIHEGDNPPDTCPLCGVDSTHFEEIKSKQEEAVSVGAQTAPVKALELDKEAVIKKALYALSYGLFIITAHSEGVDNGQCANTCFQVTSEPPRVAIGINKNNYTHELIANSGMFGVSVLNQQGRDYARNFGYRSGRGVNKFEGVSVHRGESGILLLDDVISTMEAKVIGKMDAGTHTLFLGEIMNAELIQKAEPMTYAYFRATK